MTNWIGIKWWTWSWLERTVPATHSYNVYIHIKIFSPNLDKSRKSPRGESKSWNSGKSLKIPISDEGRKAVSWVRDMQLYSEVQTERNVLHSHAQIKHTALQILPTSKHVMDDMQHWKPVVHTHTHTHTHTHIHTHTHSHTQICAHMHTNISKSNCFNFTKGILSLCYVYVLPSSFFQFR